MYDKNSSPDASFSHKQIPLTIRTSEQENNIGTISSAIHQVLKLKDWDVVNIAKLANLPLLSTEIPNYKIELNEILNYIAILNEVDTTNIPETSQVTNLENVTREDKPAPSLSQDEALSNTKSKQNGLFKVKAIFEQ